MSGDFGELDKEAVSGASGAKKPRTDAGEERSYLRAYETVPAQLLNVYGVGAWAQYDDGTVWKHMSKSLKTGAAFMTEYASPLADRRGVAANRYLQVVVAFCKYQQQKEIKIQNEALIEQKKCRELYEEIDGMLPVFEILLAPKKVSSKEGAAALRT